MKNMTVTSPAFREGGWIPRENSAWGENRSPELRISGLPENTVSLAVTLDDASHPLFPNYNHWVIWGIPAGEVIPAAIPPGKAAAGLPGAVQGRAYGKNRYKGPKPPFHWNHTYTFTVYALDFTPSLPAESGRKELFQAIEGHVLQKAALSGQYQNRKKNGK